MLSSSTNVQFWMERTGWHWHSGQRIIPGGKGNKYKVTVSTDNCFPMQIERYNRNDEPIEVIIFKAFVVHGVQRETTDR